MDKNLDRGFRLDDTLIYPLEGKIVRPDGETHVQPKAIEVLLCLVEHSGEVVDRDSILQRVWGHSAMTDEVLTRCISELRHHLNDDRNNPRFIQTIPKRGYRLLTTATEIEETEPKRPESSTQRKHRDDNGITSGSSQSLKAVLNRLKGRRIIRVAAVYAVVGSILMQVAEAAFPALHLPTWALTLVVVTIILGFPLALVFAYALDPEALTSEHRKSRSVAAPVDRKIDLLIVTALIIAVTILSIRLLSDGPTSKVLDGETVSANSIAVQPFENITRDPENELIAYGVAEEIRIRLSEIPELSVASRMSSRALAQEKLDVSDIAKRLRVSKVLEGTIRREGTNIRITVQLIVASTGHAAWSGAYDLQFEGIFKVQDDISVAVVDALKIVLSQDLRDQLVEHPTENLQALKYYLQARQYLDRPSSKSTLNDARLMFERALESDENFARAYAGLCESYIAQYRIDSNVQMITAAESACNKALHLDETLSDVHVALGQLYSATGNTRGAEQAFLNALTLNPRAIDAHRGLGRVYAAQNRIEDAEEMYRQALAILPSNWRAHNDLGFLRAKQGRYGEAAANFQRVVDLRPGDARAYSNLGTAFFLLGDFQSAAENYKRSLAISPVRGAFSNTGTMLYYAARFEEASTMFRKAINEAPLDYRLWGNLADALRFVHAEPDEANQAYNKAIELAQDNLAVIEADASTEVNMAWYYANLAQSDDARKYLSLALEHGADDRDVHYGAALVLILLDEEKNALKALENAIELGYPVQIVAATPEFQNLKDRPGFQKLIAEKNN